MPRASCPTSAELTAFLLGDLSEDALDELAAHTLPEPSGDYDSLVLYDQRRVLKEQLIDATITTCLEMTLAVSSLRGALGAEGGEKVRRDVDRGWPGLLEIFKQKAEVA